MVAVALSLGFAPSAPATVVSQLHDDRPRSIQRHVDDSAEAKGAPRDAPALAPIAASLPEATKLELFGIGLFGLLVGGGHDVKLPRSAR